jgi:hypothetical protein
MSRPSASHVESNVDLPYVRSGSDPIWVLASDLRYIVRCTTRGETELEDRRSVLSQIYIVYLYGCIVYYISLDRIILK